MTTIHCELCRVGLSIKRVQKLASERDPIKWANFIHRISQYLASYIIALDEVSKDDCTYARLWGRSEKGTPVKVSQPFVRKRHFSMLAGMVLDEGIVVAQVIEGSFNWNLFLNFLREDLVSPFICNVLILSCMLCY
ncbi:hypothetical protein BGW80DRAFT_1161441 [Lactifluus volemus]|nr:hypothetical protein BGW80DRAFT_1161441 [Lactifluus volemus]